MPAPELLAAAAAFHEQVTAAGGYEAFLGYLEADGAGDPLVGPLPPQLLADAEAAPADAREAEVQRILSVLDKAAAAAAAGGPGGRPGVTVGPPAAPGAAADGSGAAAPDPYEVLGVEDPAGISAGDMKKRYWKLSLLVHPDKCAHPGAAAAFQALSKAAALLGDAAARKQVGGCWGGRGREGRCKAVHGVGDTAAREQVGAGAHCWWRLGRQEGGALCRCCLLPGGT